jgi:chemotaxis protein CheD
MTEATVLQGEFRIGTAPEDVLTTVLGSCVATCLHDPVAGLGGLNHFLLPEGGDGRAGSQKFGLNLMELLINALLKAGARRERLVAKLLHGLYCRRRYGRLYFHGSAGIISSGSQSDGSTGRSGDFKDRLSRNRRIGN